jgi:DNA invertase Pin-like site-specific DNA recombinase
MQQRIGRVDFRNPKMKTAIYARVSTANNGQDPTMHTRELREYAERRGWTVAGEYRRYRASWAHRKAP